MKKTFLFILALCTMSAAWGATTVTKTAKQIATANSWKTKSNYYSFQLDNVITISTPQLASGNQNGYYSSDNPNDWRIYQARGNGDFTITAAEGYVIDSISLVFMDKTPKYGTDAGLLYNEKAYYCTDGTDNTKFANVKVGGQSSVTFLVRNYNSTSNQQARISQFSVTYSVAETPDRPTPEISFEKEAITITNLYTTEPVENKLTVTEGAGEVTYTSSNPLVAKIVSNQVSVVGVGTATITATTAENEDYASASASYALTVNEPEGEAAVSEDFDGKLPLATSYQTEPVNFTDQDSIYTWTVNGHRYDGTWLRFATNANACMTSQGIQEGGVKRLSFTWKRANGECTKIHTTIKALDGDGNEIVDRSIELAGSEDQTSNQTYNMRFEEVKQNAQFYLRNESDGFVILISDMKIIPYLLYTKKLDDVTILAGETQATYKNEAIINNTDATPTFSIISSEPASIATIAADGTVTATAAGTIKVQAAWENVTTTYTLNITKNTLPVPQVSFEDGNAVTKDMNVKNYVNPLTKEGDGEVTYTSSDETVAEVDAEGVITITGEGVTTITAKVAACATYAAAEASYVLTTTDPKDDAYVETFERNSGGSSTADRVGAYYTWTITTGARTRETDKLFNETPSIWLSGNGDASMETTVEGGVKRVSFLWNKFSKNPASVIIDVTAGDITRSITKAVTSGENQNNPDLVFNSNFGIKSNTNLKIANPQNTTALQIGPIAITPYIFYTVKDTLIDITEVATFTNDKFIDNRDDEVAIVYSIVGENDGVATIDAATGEVTGLKAGKVTVQAKWGEVTTTYQLTITGTITPTGFGQSNKDKGQRTMKMMRDGQLMIIHNGKRYSVVGLEL